MAKVTLNIKIPINVMNSLIDKDRLNSEWLSTFIENNFIWLTENIKKEPFKTFTVNYNFKVDKQLHRRLKYQAIHLDMALNEMIGRLLGVYYVD